MDTQLARPAEHAAAVVWVDMRHALIARLRDGHSVVSEDERDADPEFQYLLRVVHEAAGCDRVVIMGPDAARLDFEREYVTLYHRPDRLIDVGVAVQPGRRELIEQLAMVEPALASH
jgi:hypothetical protein